VYGRQSVANKMKCNRTFISHPKANQAHSKTIKEYGEAAGLEATCIPMMVQ
jgi:hypothetical protein